MFDVSRNGELCDTRASDRKSTVIGLTCRVLHPTYPAHRSVLGTLSVWTGGTSSWDRSRGTRLMILDLSS
jgi:hypothetical protein